MPEWEAARIDILPRLGLPVLMVDPGPLAYLWAHFLTMRPARGSAMGIEPWDWANVSAFAGEMMPDRESWEVQALMDMSQAYCAGLGGTDPFARSPLEIALGDRLAALMPAQTEPGRAILLNLPED